MNSLNGIVTFGKIQCSHSPMKISRLRSLITENRKHNTNIYIYGHTWKYVYGNEIEMQTDRARRDELLSTRF